MSPSLPYSGVETVAASRYDVTTHERWLRPPRSPTIVGSAVETIVWSSAARNIPSISATNTVVSARPVSRPSVGASAGPRDAGVALVSPTVTTPIVAYRGPGPELAVNWALNPRLGRIESIRVSLSMTRNGGSDKTATRGARFMARLATVKVRVGTVAALVGVALLVAACGSSSSSSSSAAASTASSSAASGTAVAIHTAKGPGGTYIVGPSGRALYLWVADTDGKSSCSGACAKVWPPLTTTAAPTGSGGVIASDLSTTTRSDGTEQVTYKGHPLYYYVGDTHAGTWKGEGVDGFGAKWWLVTPSGSAITVAAKKSGSSSGGSSGSSSGSSWG